jgi:hypothetical protein
MFYAAFMPGSKYVDTEIWTFYVPYLPPSTVTLKPQFIFIRAPEKE